VRFRTSPQAPKPRSECNTRRDKDEASSDKPRSLLIEHVHAVDLLLSGTSCLLFEQLNVGADIVAERAHRLPSWR
jgi:hypothetical protein